MRKLFLLIPIIFLLTGCYNYRELNDLAIVSGISIGMDDNLYKVTAQVVNPKKQQDTSSSKEPDFIIYTKKDKSLQEALRKIVLESPKKLYGAQIEVLIIDEELAKNNLKSILDFFSRDPELRSEFNVLIGKSDKILEINTPLDKISSQNISDSLEASTNYLGYSNLTTYHELINYYLNPNIEIALPSVKAVGNEKIGEETENIEETVSDANIVISDIAVFKDNKMLGYLTEDESLVYNIVTGNAKTWLIKNEYKDNQYIINEIISTKVGLDANVKKKKITISIEGNSAIAEVNYDCDLESMKTIEKIQKKLNKTTEDLVEKNIKSVIKKYNSDIYGFRDLFYKTNPNEYNKLKKNWYDDVFKDLDIVVKSNIKIIEKGNLNGGIYHEQK